jgi:hypothetical protein
VNTDREQSSATDGSRPQASFPALLGCLVALLALESLTLVGLVVWLIVEAVSSAAADTASGIALLVIAALCAVWVSLTAVAAARRRSWMRGSSITWHLLVLAVAIGCFTGVTAVPQAGWVLLLVAVLGIGLVLVPSVTRATAADVQPVGTDEESAKQQRR